MNELTNVNRPVLQFCPICTTQESVQIETLGPSLWRYTCLRSCKQHPDPYSWMGTTPDGPATGKVHRRMGWDSLPVKIKDQFVVASGTSLTFVLLDRAPKQLV